MVKPYRGYFVQPKNYIVKMESLDKSNHETIQVWGLIFAVVEKLEVYYICTKFQKNRRGVSILCVDLTWDDPEQKLEDVKDWLII